MKILIGDFWNFECCKKIGLALTTSFDFIYYYFMSLVFINDNITWLCNIFFIKRSMINKWDKLSHINKNKYQTMHNILKMLYILIYLHDFVFFFFFNHIILITWLTKCTYLLNQWIQPLMIINGLSKNTVNVYPVSDVQDSVFRNNNHLKTIT